jgi:hypothetical protein
MISKIFTERMINPDDPTMRVMEVDSGRNNNPGYWKKERKQLKSVILLLFHFITYGS